MKLLLLFFALSLLYKAIMAQDLIIKNNGKDTIKCNIIEDKIIFLRYTNYYSTDTIVYQINQEQFDYYIKAPQVSTKSADEISASSQINQKNNKSNIVQNPENPEIYKFYIGFGAGMDYGGFGGIRFAFMPVKYVAAFAAGGYALIGFGYNVGVSLRISPETKVCPYVSAMYGYNGVIQIKGASQYDKIYYGPSFNFGFEFRSSRLQNYFNAEIVFPIRSQEFHQDLEDLKKNPLIKIDTEPPPIGVSFGYHFVF